MSYSVGKGGLAYARLWHKVDAQDRILGRLATSIAVTLMGKHKPIWHPSIDCGDYVVVTNAEKVKLSGKSAQKKIYRYHTGYPGGLKTVTYKQMLQRRPEDIIRLAVKRMLPKNQTRDVRMSRLKIVVGDQNPWEANIAKDYERGLVIPVDTPKEK